MQRRRSFEQQILRERKQRLGFVLGTLFLVFSFVSIPNSFAFDEDEKETANESKKFPLEIITTVEEVENVDFVRRWSQEAEELVQKWFPKLCVALDSEGFEPVKRLEIQYKKTKGVAWTQGAKITISIDWISQHPEDKGMVFHELVHVVQQYAKPVPGWVTEGIADNLRFFQFEPPAIPPLRKNSKYTDSYRVTAAFFQWILETTDDKDFIKNLNRVCRDGAYQDDFFEKETGKTLDQLWREYHAARYRE